MARSTQLLLHQAGSPASSRGRPIVANWQVRPDEMVRTAYRFRRARPMPEWYSLLRFKRRFLTLGSTDGNK